MAPVLRDDDLAFVDNRSRRDASDAEDRDLRVVDDRRLKEPSELARARHRERGVAELHRLESSIARSCREPVELGTDLVDGPGVSFTHDRHDES